MNVKEVLEYTYGLYIWQNPDGSYFKNADGEFLSIPSKIGDIRRMSTLKATAEHYGAPPGGKAVFQQGARQVSKSEWEDHMERFIDGKIGDPYDKGNIQGEV